MRSAKLKMVNNVWPVRGLLVVPTKIIPKRSSPLIWRCHVCQRTHRERDEAERCEQDPLLELELEVGTLIRYVNRPTNEERIAEIIGRDFAMNGDWRKGEWQPHYRIYTCRSSDIPYDFLVGAEDVLASVGENVGPLDVAPHV